MKWNTDSQPDLISKGWMSESNPVLCRIEYINESGKTCQDIAVCTLCKYGDKEPVWEPSVGHLTATTSPCADYSIEAAEGFTVLSWTEIV